MNEKERLYESFTRMIVKDPSILQKILERLESNEIVDAEGRPVKELESPDLSEG